MATIGLFGTCGGSTWRQKFVEYYEAHNIQYFNPQIDDWTPDCANIEAQHLVDDEIILFPVTGETYGVGSLAETGFSIMQAIRSNSNRSIVILIDSELDDAIMQSDPQSAKDSLRARALVKAHLRKVKHDNVYIVSDLDTLLKLSVQLHEIHTKLEQLKVFNVNAQDYTIFA